MDSNRTYSYPLPLERARTLAHIVFHYMWYGLQLAVLHIMLYAPMCDDAH
jgi:hypothetical protein